MNRLRPGLLALMLIAGAVWVGYFFVDTRPLSQWILPRVLFVWAAMLLFAGSCYGAGLRVMDRLWPESDTTPGRRALAFSAGVLIFFVGTFLVGIAGGLGPLFFWLWPAALVAWGLKPLAAEGARFWGWLERVRLTPADMLGMMAATLIFFLIYVPMLAPENINYDARQYHLSFAELYAVAGKIMRLREGPILGNQPQLATILFTWALEFPVGELYDRLLLALHVELVTVVATVAAIPALCRALVPGQGNFRWATLAFFLFPGIFIYDTGIQGGAEHFAAMFVAPAWLAVLRAWKKLDWKNAILVAIPISGLALVKYTTAVALAPLVAAMVVRMILQLSRGKYRKALLEPLTLVGVGLIITSPHWLKNLIWYRDPFYPLLYKYVPIRPWTSDSEDWLKFYLASNPVPHSGTVQGLKDALWSFGDYHLANYNWGDFHGTEPAFGSLFTAGLLALLFLKGTKRVWALVLAIHLGIFTWFYVSHLERYLALLIPWMAAVVAIVAVLAWKQGNWLVRVAVVAFIAVQTLAQSDLPFIPSHRMNGRQSPLARGVELLGAGYRNDVAARLHAFSDWEAVGKATPTDANILVHIWPLHLGINRRTVIDGQFGQMAGLSYAHLGSLNGIYTHLTKELEVTHVAWNDSEDNDSLAGELLFRAFARTATAPQTSAAGWMIGTIPPTPPAEPKDTALLIGCGYPYATGLYTVNDLGENPPGPGYVWSQLVPRKKGTPGELVAEAGYVVVESKCAQGVDLQGFTSLGRRGGERPVDMYVRVPPKKVAP